MVECTWRYRPRRHAAHRLRLVVPKGTLQTRAASFRCARNPVLCSGFRREKFKGRDQRLRVVVCPRNSEPLRAVQSADPFAALSARAVALGFDTVATGPPPAVGWAAAPRRRPGTKDQSYVLAVLTAQRHATPRSRSATRRSGESGRGAAAWRSPTSQLTTTSASYRRNIRLFG